MALFAAGVTFAQAAASAWVGGQHGEVRLITAVDSIQGRVLRAGLEFRYPAGWHGYWHTPGDTDIPPTLNWGSSVHLHSASVMWPAPSRLAFSGLQNAVYSGDVVLPLLLELDDARGVRLNLSLDYASCSNICVPMHAELSLDLPAGSGGASAETGLIDRAWALVPGTPNAASIEVLANLLQGSGPHRRLIVQLHSGSIPFRAPDLFIEGAGTGLPSPPLVQLTHRGLDVAMTVALPGRSPVVQSAPLWLTVVDGLRAVEFPGPQN